MGEAISQIAKWIGFYVFVVPLMLIWILVQMPFAFIEATRKRQRDKRFAASMQAAGRVVSWVDARTQVDSQHGTLVEEFVCAEGYRLWWTPEYVPDVCPYPCRFKSDEATEAKHVDQMLRDGQFERVKELKAAVVAEYAASSEWCRSRYTSPESGTALLVDIARSDEQEWMHYLTGAAAGRRFIHIETN